MEGGGGMGWHIHMAGRVIGRWSVMVVSGPVRNAVFLVAL